MNQTDYLALGMGGPTLLMHDGDACANIRGFAVQALEDCVFSVFALNLHPFVTLSGNPDYIESATHGDETLTLTAHTFNTGDKVLLQANGATLPTGFFDNQIYYIINATANTVKLAVSTTTAAGGSAVTISDNGSGLTVATITLINNDNSNNTPISFQPKFAVSGASALEITKHVDGNTDMFATTGAEDVKLPKGMTVYLAVTDITLTTGACVVYTRK